MTDLILQGITGSQAYGLATPHSDLDRLGVFVKPLADLLSLAPGDDTRVTKDAQGEICIHEVGKFINLSLACNPTIMELYWLGHYAVCTELGDLLLSIRKDVLSVKALSSYIGYVNGQAKRLLARGDFDPDLKKRTEKHGRHCLRLLIQGEQLVSTGELTVALTDKEAQECREAGILADHDPLAFSQMIEERVQHVRSLDCVLPDQPNRTKVNEVLLKIRGVL